MSDAVLAIGGEGRAHALPRRAYARDVRCRALAGRLDLQYRGKRTVARRAARTVGNGEEFRTQPSELLSRGPQLGDAVRRRGREELEAEDTVGRLTHRRHCQSRFVSRSADSAQEIML